MSAPEFRIEEVSGRLVATLHQNMEEQIRKALFMYSEWLDADQGLIERDVDRDIDRTHEELVEDFIKHLVGSSFR